MNLPAAIGLAALLFTGLAAQASNYPGNGNNGFDGAVGNGTLILTDDGTNISGTLDTGGSMNDCLVIYVDTGAGGGFSSTTGMEDNGDGSRRAISGYNNSENISVMTFMSGFSPQYAIALGPNDNNFGGIWKLATGGSESLLYSNSVALTPTGTGTGPFTFSFGVTNLGLTPGVPASIKIFGTYIANNAFRSQEAIAGNDSGIAGYYTFTQTAYSTYSFHQQVTQPVTFQVDMSLQIANGSFIPGTSVINVAGTFQNPPYSGIAMTNNPLAANTNIYSVTIQDPDAVGTMEQYRFNINQATWEASDNRLFTLQQGTNNTPLVYFSDLYPSPSATTNSVTFQIDMTFQVNAGNFFPGSESIEVAGTLEYSNQWSVPGLILTNNPASTNTYLYSGTFPTDGNYPGSWEQYKFIIVSNGNATYESIPNRDFATPTNSATLPVAYFNNQVSNETVNVTFQVDMTSQVVTGAFGAGDTVGVAGDFPGTFFYPLTATLTNTNIFTGTFSISEQPGSIVGYKFFDVVGSTTNYEQPVSTGGNNREFVLATASSQTLPLVLWGDEPVPDINNLLSAATYITFTVDMTNAVDESGNPFNVNTDAVLINGSFIQPNGWLNGLWTDQYPSYDSPYDNYVMGEVGLTSTFTNTFQVPAGSPLQISYKYAIYHGALSYTANTNCDNEAPINVNHSRYIRSNVGGTYVFPTDVFGQQTNGNPAIAAEANEQNYGGLTAARVSPGVVGLTWLGRPGVFLQTSSNLASKEWTIISNSGVGISATNLPSTNSNAFYQLVNP